MALPTKTTYVAPAPAPIPAKTVAYVAPAPAPTPVKTITPTYVPPTLIAAVTQPAPAPYVAPAIVPRTDVMSLVTPIATPAPAPYVAPAIIPRTEVLSYVAPTPAPAPYVAPAIVPRTDVMSLVTPIATPAPYVPPAPVPRQDVMALVPAPYVPPAPVPRQDVMSLVTPIVEQPAPIKPLVPVATNVAPTWVVGANCTLGGGRSQGVRTAEGICQAVPGSTLNPAIRSPDMSLISNALAAAQKARANKPCINSRGQKGVWSKDGKTCLIGVRDHRAPVKVTPRPLVPRQLPGTLVGGRMPIIGRGGSAVPPSPLDMIRGGRGGGVTTPGGQTAPPSIVAANCGAGQEYVNGACQALPGTTISPTTGTVAQPNQGGPVTYAPWIPNSQHMVGPAPVIETTPEEDEQGAPPAVVPQGMSTNTKIALGVGGALAAFLLYRSFK